MILNNADCETPYPSLTVEQKLAFTITEIDVETEDDLGSYEEEYTELQPLALATKDYLSSLAIPQGQFKESWEQLGAQGQRDGSLSDLTQTFQLPYKQMTAAVGGVSKFFGSMSVCDGSNKINVTEKVHNLLLSGQFFGKHQVYVRAQIGFNQEYGCVIKLSVRSLDASVSQSLLECIN